MEEELNLTKDLKDRTIAFLDKWNINRSIQVQNAIDDVFDENDFIDNEDSVNIYFSEDLDDFLADTSCMTILNIQVSGGNSSGDILDKYTYYGTLTNERAYRKEIKLFKGEEEIDTVEEVEPTELNKLQNPLDFCIVVIVEKEFHMGEYTETPRLYMYIPISGKNIE